VRRPLNASSAATYRTHATVTVADTERAPTPGEPAVDLHTPVCELTAGSAGIVRSVAGEGRVALLGEGGQRLLHVLGVDVD